MHPNTVSCLLIPWLVTLFLLAAPAKAVPAHCGGDANGVLDVTADGHLTYFQNNSGRTVHTSFTNFGATIRIDLGPGEKKPVAVNLGGGLQGFAFSSCTANF